MKLYNVKGDFRDNNEAIDFLKGFVWSECETTKQDKPAYLDYIESFEGVDLYYCYAGDYYVFEDIDE